MNGSKAPGSSVTITVAGCSGGGCSSSTTSQSNGYYVVANLNLPAGGTVNGFASNGFYSGTNTTTANEEYAAFMNITLCRPPSAPVLTDQPDTHNGSVSLQWINGTDFDGYPTYTQFQFDSSPWIIVSSPYNVSGLAFGSYTWRVRTCNALCCSAVSSDSFNVYNNPPSIPQLVIIPDSNSSNASLNWASGVDPDGDSTYDQYGFRRFDQPYTTENASPPVLKTNLSGSYFWRVRTCDSFGWCSDWNESSFTTLACGPVSCVCPPCGGGECPSAFNVFTLAPSIVQDGSAFVVDVTLENKDFVNALNYVSFEVEGTSSELSIQSVQVARVNSGGKVQVRLPGEARLASSSDKTFPLVLKIFKNNRQSLVYEKPFEIRVVRLEGVTPVFPVSPSPCPPCPFLPGCRFVCPTVGATLTPEEIEGRISLGLPDWWWLIVVLLLLLVAAWLWKRHKKKKKPKPGLLAFAEK